MGTRSLLRSSLSALALIAAIAAFPSASHAITFNLIEDHCTGGIPPFGSVILTQNGTTVDVDVDLFGTNAFVKTGSVDFQVFKFNATGIVVGDITVDQNNPGQTLAPEIGAFNRDGTGDFLFGIACTTCGNGASDAFATNIIFHVAYATIADLTAANNLGNIFVADIIGSTGNTGPVAAIAPVSGPIVGAGLPGSDLGNRWASLVATASADCLNRLARPLRTAPRPSAFRASDDVGMKRPDHGGFAGGSFGPRINTDYLKAPIEKLGLSLPVVVPQTKARHSGDLEGLLWLLANRVLLRRS
jgi:hypothetical protein